MLPSTRTQQRLRPVLLFYLFVARISGDCPRPLLDGNIILTDAALLMNEYPDNIEISLACPNGYTQDSGSATMKCIDGAWSNPDLMCKKKDCGPPPPRPHMTFNTSQGTLFGDVAGVICDKGYLIIGSAYKQCYNSGWTGKSTKCEIVTCDIPEEITNGKSSWTSSDSPEYGELISYVCNEGYKLVGQKAIMCTEEGEYDSTPPQCLGGDLMTDADSTTMTIRSTLPYYSKGDKDDNTVDTPKDTGYTPVIVSVVCVTIAVCIAVLFINRLLNKRKGSQNAPAPIC